MTETHTGIIIKKVDFNADDQVVTILTSSEIISFIALGTKKLTSKNGVALEYGNIINAEIFRARLTNKLSKLKKATIVTQPPLKVSDTARVIISIVKDLSKVNATNATLFAAILKSFKYFGNDHNHQIKTYVLFNTLSPMGLMPIMNGCVVCGRPDRIIDFSFDDGGFKCALHSERNLDVKLLAALGDLSDFNKYKDVDPLMNKKIYQILSEYVSQFIYMQK